MNHFPCLAAPKSLLQHILHTVEIERVRRAVIRWSVFTVLVLAALIGSAFFFYREAVYSGLGEYLSQFLALITTDPRLVAAHWGELMTSIGESVPVVSLTLFGVVIAVLLWSADKLIAFSKRWAFI